jgi:protein-S-isoprenylcysteine O-methyltransferase Ste14
MEKETIVKISILILMVLFFLARSKFTRHHKKFEPKTLIKYVAAFILFFLYLGKYIDFALLPINFYVRIIVGGILIILGLALFFASHYYLGNNWSPNIEKRFSKSKTLITTGPYRYIRHPIYTASFITLLGFGILSANWFLFGIPLLVLIAFYSRKIPKEEKSLILNFGKKYLEYKKRTGSLLPKNTN